MQRNINLVDLAKSFQTSIYLQKSASIQPRTSYLIFFDFPSLQGFNFHRPPAHMPRLRLLRGPQVLLHRPGALRGRRALRPHPERYLWGPRGLVGISKFRTARSRLYRSQLLQANTRWKALAETYNMHSLQKPIFC